MAVTINGTNGITTNSGTVISASTIGVGGATPAASGAGITFPATQSASSDANTLDDYEEGTWTPTDNSGAGLTITNLGCTYTKIGNTVSIRAYLSYPSTANGNAANLGGLPFATNNWGPVSIMSASSPNAGLVRAVSGQTNMDIKSNVSDSTLSNSNLSGSFLIFSFTYRVN
jgi:hypothetical protein